MGTSGGHACADSASAAHRASVAEPYDGPMTHRDGHGNWHFWVDDDTASAATGWNPDRDPTRFASGIGHNLLELYARLAMRGLPVSIGTHIPRDTVLVIRYTTVWSDRKEGMLGFRAARFPNALILSDTPTWWRSVLDPDLLIPPSRSAETVWRRGTRAQVRHVPALPQRGLVPRAPAPSGSIRTAVFKGNPENVPEYLHDPEFVESLRATGVRVVLDVPAATNGSEQRWHDFHDADVMICTRNDTTSEDLLRKPATRLINAWCAGSIPLVGPEPAYLELVRDGVDGFVVRDAREVSAAIARLAADAGLARAMTQNAHERGQAFSTDRVLDEWIAVLSSASGPRRRLLATWQRRVTSASRAARPILAYRVRWAKRAAHRLLGRAVRLWNGKAQRDTAQ